MAFGPSLQQERERQGISLEAVAEATRVSVRHLRALEQGHHDQLPGGIFNRGFVQSYCRFLHLDETEWLARYAESRPVHDHEWAEFAENISRNRASAAPAMRLRWWGVLALLLLLAALAYAAWHFVVKPRLGHPTQTLPASASVPAQHSKSKRFA